MWYIAYLVCSPPPSMAFILPMRRSLANLCIGIPRYSAASLDVYHSFSCCTGTSFTFSRHHDKIYHNVVSRLYLMGKKIAMDHTSEYCQCVGKKCTKCHKLLCVGNFTKDKRLKSGLMSKCKACGSVDNKKWRQQNKEYNAARKRAWNEAHVEHNKEVMRKYRQRNAGRIKTYNRQRYLTYVERERARGRAYYHQNRERQMLLKRVRRQSESVKKAESAAWKAYYIANRNYLNQQVIRWGRNNPRRRAAIEATRRTRKTLAGGSYTIQEWLDLCAKYEYRCLCCGKQEPEIRLAADHIMPVAMGGSSNIDNIQPLCKSCNSSKGPKLIDFRPPTA